MSDMNMDRNSLNGGSEDLVKETCIDDSSAGQHREETRRQNQQVDVFYIVNQINRVLEQTDYLHEAIASLSKMSDGECGEPYSAGNIAGQAKANAFKDIVCYRETTNQQVLRMYEKMYDDFISKGNLQQDRTDNMSSKENMSPEMAKDLLRRAVEDVIYSVKVAPDRENENS